MEIAWFRHEDNWQEVKDAAMNTVGKDKGVYPTPAWKKKILLSEHSPIRRMNFAWRWQDLPYWVSVHMVRHKVGLYEHCYGVVYGGAAHTELHSLLEVLHKLLYLEAAVDGVYCVKDGKTLRCSPAFVLLQIFGKYLVDNIHNLAVLHISPVPRADTGVWSRALPDAPVPVLRLS